MHSQHSGEAAVSQRGRVRQGAVVDMAGGLKGRQRALPLIARQGREVGNLCCKTLPLAAAVLRMGCQG